MTQGSNSMMSVARISWLMRVRNLSVSRYVCTQPGWLYSRARASNRSFSSPVTRHNASSDATSVSVTGWRPVSILDTFDSDQPRTCAAYLPLRLAFSIADLRSEEHTSELQSRLHLVCRPL